MAVSQKPRKKKSSPSARIVKIDMSEASKTLPDLFFPVDWNKVKNLNDIKAILSNMGLGCRTSAPNYNDLKKYLSDIPQTQQ